MTTAIHRLVESCRRGDDPSVVTRMASGWAVMGRRQVLRGYCLLLPDPVVPHLNAFPAAAREQFMMDVSVLGEAVQRATGALRINYAIFGNLEPALHAHVHPRYVDEPEAMRTGNPWSYDWSQAPMFDPALHSELRDLIRHNVQTQIQERARERSAPGALHHLDLTVSDMQRSTAFYDRWLPMMGLRRIADCAEGPLWRGEQLELGLQQTKSSVLHDRSAPGLHHLAFAAADRDAVVRLYEALCMGGATVLDAPAEYPSYAPGYFAVYFPDPDGIKLEYVFTPA
ncbi:VOC family protein [Povalibacter sp.]|uniref:VOC family protein n=1 Tax=Povalibacter sp. TaxID=1962978 RepID=UPI002F3E4462